MYPGGTVETAGCQLDQETKCRDKKANKDVMERHNI